MKLREFLGRIGLWSHRKLQEPPRGFWSVHDGYGMRAYTTDDPHEARDFFKQMGHGYDKNVGWFSHDGRPLTLMYDGKVMPHDALE